MGTARSVRAGGTSSGRPCGSLQTATVSYGNGTEIREEGVRVRRKEERGSLHLLTESDQHAIEPPQDIRAGVGFGAADGDTGHKYGASLLVHARSYGGQVDQRVSSIADQGGHTEAHLRVRTGHSGKKTADVGGKVVGDLEGGMRGIFRRRLKGVPGPRDAGSV